MLHLEEVYALLHPRRLELTIIIIVLYLLQFYYYYSIIIYIILYLYQPLHYIFSLSLSQCYLPLEWHTHLIKPIFKSGDKSLIKNYRPISLLCIVSKVLERIVYKKIIDFVYNTMSFFQFGFLKGRSTLQQMLLLFNAILSSDSQVDVITLTFGKPSTQLLAFEALELWYL